ncbi:hypothetical protein HPB49_022351 [Dermacentor silvarum]|uniref:Uncharacterized protein n=1 Tax=Dermacentor silvarum TaxID=543639 RepID=A0ACB8D8N2_DERSI|nr:hypothetical protein HPB49_022351 [Dermacentor silvarum]
MFPLDGLCDYIFYDSMYKNNRNPLIGNWDYDLLAILSKAQKADRTKSQYGVGFAFEQRSKLIKDLASTSLEVFWGHNLFHFGIIDCPMHGVTQAQMDEFKNTFKPDLFISLGHQLRGDPEKRRCIATPPAILEKPMAYPDEHDLHDAARALVSISSEAGGPRLSISVSMKGRWSVLQPNVRAEVFAPCVTSNQGPFYGSYTEVCDTPPFSNDLMTEVQRYAMRTFDKATRRMFVFENQQTLCKKLCLIKANYTKVEFGVAVYDLDYEDADDTCSLLNLLGAYSRLQTVSTVQRYLASQFTDPSKEAECSKLWYQAV